MATFTFFEDFSEQLSKGVHNFGTDTYKVVLTNSTPNATHTILSDITQISNGNGYTTGGATSTISVSETGGTATIGSTGSDVGWTASGGDIGPFTHAVWYNDSATSPLDALVGYIATGSLTITNGNNITLDVGANGLFTIS